MRCECWVKDDTCEVKATHCHLSAHWFLCECSLCLFSRVATARVLVHLSSNIYTGLFHRISRQADFGCVPACRGGNGGGEMNVPVCHRAPSFVQVNCSATLLVRCSWRHYLVTSYADGIWAATCMLSRFRSRLPTLRYVTAVTNRSKISTLWIHQHLIVWVLCSCLERHRRQNTHETISRLFQGSH